MITFQKHMKPLTEFEAFLPEDIFLRADGTVWQCREGHADVAIEPRFNSNNKGFLEFAAGDHSLSKFTVWLSRAFCKLFVDQIPQGYEVVHRDKNRSNFKPDNLALRPKDSTKSTYRLVDGPPLGPRPDSDGKSPPGT